MFNEAKRDALDSALIKWAVMYGTGPAAQDEATEFDILYVRMRFNEEYLVRDISAGPWMFKLSPIGLKRLKELGIDYD